MRATSYDHQILRPSRSVHVEAFRAARVPRRRSDVRNLWRRVGDFPKLSSARGLLSVDRIFGFSSRKAKEHVCGIGFYRRSLDVHRSNRERHGLLGLQDLDTAVSHGSCEMLWSLDPTDKHV